MEVLLEKCLMTYFVRKSASLAVIQVHLKEAELPAWLCGWCMWKQCWSGSIIYKLG